MVPLFLSWSSAENSLDWKVGREESACVLFSSRSMKENTPLVQKELHLLCEEALEAFLVAGVQSPLTHTTIPFVSSHHSPHPFHCFPLLLICPWVYVKRLADGGKKQLQCDKCFSNYTLISKTDCRNTAFWQWRIAMVTIQPAVQKALSRGNKSQQISCPANELSL